jgi:4-hydroxy-tetrahydrodipicolinate synthase
MEVKMDFGEVITAMVTPFDDDGKLDLVAAGKLINHLIENGSDSIVLSGTTGESPTLTDEEKISLFDYAVKNFSSKIKIIAGTGSNDTRHSIELTKEARNVGVDGILLVTPYYNKPGYSGLYKHFEAIASETDIPIIMYNVPSRTSCNMGAGLCLELAKIANITGVKEASSDFKQISEITSKAPRDFLVYSGNDGDTLPMLSLGAHGIISVASHLVGKDIKKMISLFKSGNVVEAAKLHHWLHDIFYGLFITTNPVPLKEALNLIGIKVGKPRLPLTCMSDSELEVFRGVIGKYNFLKK